MMMNIAILQLLVFIVLIGVIMFFIKRQKKMGLMTIKGRSHNWIFSIYLLALIVCTVIYFMIPSSDMTYSEPKSIEQSMEEEQELHDRLFSGDIAEASENLRNEFYFEFTEDVLIVKPTYQDNYYSGNILFERVEDFEDEVQVYLYSGNSYIDGFDFTDRIDPPSFVLEENELQVIERSSEISFAKLAQEFTLTQFSDRHSGNPFHTESSSYHGAYFVYIQVPMDVDVTSAYSDIELTEVK
ncbi:hypothetical protein [Alteribacter aurantiacus]|uniref:hypothetical protein n=1 Tax=Alteribacter aurantiacus TaxID=254410 RepID=UPI0004122361|nr:hypothetical protein [Alteribacter aurantiacus]